MFTSTRGLVLAVLVLLATAGAATRAEAANRFGIECRHLRGVRVEMKDGRRLVGYVGWISEDFKSDKEPGFPQSLLDSTAWIQETKPLDLYTTLYPVSKKILRRVFPDGAMRMVIATAAGTLTLPIKQVVRIRALRMRYDGIEATIDGVITVHSRTMIRLLMSGQPFATFKNDNGHVLVSFNRQIGRRNLAAIDAELTKKIAVFDAERTKLIGNKGNSEFNKAWDQVLTRLERRRVVSIEYITD